MQDFQESQALSTTPQVHLVEPLTLAQASQLATAAMQARVLADYQQRKDPDTLRRQRTDLATFVTCLAEHHIAVPPDLAEDLSHWRAIEHGLVELFVRWQVQRGYAIRTIEARLSTVKVYARLAAKAGHLPTEQLALIRAVESYRGREAVNLDKHRPITRVGDKKATPVEVTASQVELLKQRPETRDGRRDQLIICLIFDHGLRCSEVTALDMSGLQLQAGKLIFYREKVNEWDSHELTPDTLRAAHAYLSKDRKGAAPDAPLFIGKCSKVRIDVRSVRSRVQWLGLHILGIPNLTPHDGRHFSAYDALENGTTIDRLQAFGGWSTPVRPLEYAKRKNVGNKGVKLSATRKYEQSGEE